MRSHGGPKLALLSIALNTVLMIGYSQDATCQKRPASSSVQASFSVRPVVVVPDDGAFDPKEIKGASVLSNDLVELRIPVEGRGELTKGPQQHEKNEMEVVYRGKVTKETQARKKVIVFVAN